MKRSTVRRLERLEKQPAKDPYQHMSYDEFVKLYNETVDQCVAEEGLERTAAFIKSLFTPEQLAELSDIRAIRTILDAEPPS